MYTMDGYGGTKWELGGAWWGEGSNITHLNFSKSIFQKKIHYNLQMLNAKNAQKISAMRYAIYQQLRLEVQA